MNNPGSMNTDIVLRVSHVAKTYDDHGLKTKVLVDASFELRRGQTLAIVGASGSGKSTLLHIIGGLDSLNHGQVVVEGHVLSTLSHAGRGRVRNRSLGFIYQFHHLLPEFTALENVCMPLLIRGTSRAKAQRHAQDLLARVGLDKRMQHRPAALSGGERQRCAVARALVTRPACVLGDEPTGNLDQHHSAQVYALMLELRREFGTSFVLVTHDLSLAARMDRILALDNGMLREPVAHQESNLVSRQIRQ